MPKSLLKSLFLWNALATIILLPRLVNAQTCEVYVSPSGSDSSAGTLSAPWRTVQHAFDYARPGDTVCFRGGTYAMTTTTGYNQALYRSGTPTSRITFMNYPGEVAIIAGSTKVQADYVTFQGAPASTTFKYVQDDYSVTIDPTPLRPSTMIVTITPLTPKA